MTNITLEIARTRQLAVAKRDVSRLRCGRIALRASLLILLWLRVSAAPVCAQVIDTVAGGGVGDGGPATAALISRPISTALDASGNLYFVESQRVRKVTAATGVIMTVAGTGEGGYNGDNIAATTAKLNSPVDAAVDAAGNLYISDRSGLRIRKVAADSGIINTVAGTGLPGYNDESIPASRASLTNPSGIAVDLLGNFYFVDAERVRKVTVATGVITTVAGTGQYGYNGDNIAATSAALMGARGVAVDASGNLYIAERDGYRIRKVVVATGLITTVAGNGVIGYTGDNGTATSANLALPGGIAVDASGNLYISSAYHGVIRKVTAATGVITTVADIGKVIYKGTVLPDVPSRISIDSSGDLYIADNQKNLVSKVAITTGVVTTVAGAWVGYIGDGSAATSASLGGPSGVALDAAGNIYVADSNNMRVRKVTATTGVITTVAGTGSFVFNGDNIPATSAALKFPVGVAIDSSGDLYIADSNNRIRKVTMATGLIATVAGTTTDIGNNGGYNGDNIAATSAKLDLPSGVTVDASGSLYIADKRNQRIRKVTVATGLITTVAGTGTASYNGDNIAATSAALDNPEGIAVDASGNFYIADSTHRIRKVSGATGIITTVAGTGIAGYNGDNVPATSAQLDNPSGIAIDASGNLYIADRNNGRIRKVVVSTGIISTVAGTGRYGYNGDGNATSAMLTVPAGVALDSSGNLYIADQYNGRIRKVSAAPAESYQGLWWSAPAGSESGWGINFAHQGNIIFATWFTYDTNGRALWLSMTANKFGTDYIGTLVQTRGPVFSAVPFPPAAVTATPVGSGTLTFSDTNNGRFAYILNGTTQTKAITRQAFGPMPKCTFGTQSNLTLATNYQDLWWAAPGAIESGWGVNFTHQGDVIFATWFTYDGDGAPMWLSATAVKTGIGVYAGTLYRTTGPAFNAVPFLGANVGRVSAGTLTLTFFNGNSGAFEYTAYGITQSKPITRQVFNAPGTLCQ